MSLEFFRNSSTGGVCCEERLTRRNLGPDILSDFGFLDGEQPNKQPIEPAVDSIVRPMRNGRRSTTRNIHGAL